MGRIKCEVKGYEHTCFEVGQHWKTRDDRVVELCRRIRICLSGKAPGYLEPLEEF